MVKKHIPIGVSDFKKLIETNCYFVDKSLFIEEVIKFSESLIWADFYDLKYDGKTCHWSKGDSFTWTGDVWHGASNFGSSDMIIMQVTHL